MKKARIGYQLSNKQNNSKERSITHGDIQIAWTFMRINHEQFKQDILEHEQVLKTMIEKGYTSSDPMEWKKINLLRQNDLFRYRYIKSRCSLQ
ncbi:MAG: hypothetical protein ACJ702_03090, partial [Nitrososphaeraceae archaeon]